MTDWNFFGIIDATDDDPTLYPVLSGPEAPLPVALEPLDGPGPSYYTGTAAQVLGTDARGALTRIVTLPSDLKWEILVTDARVIVYCVKFDKGGGWGGLGLGGLAVAAAANAVSKARAAARRKGKLMVAQVRYPWLQQALATPKVDWKTSGKVRLRVNAAPSGANRFIMLELTVSKHLSALTVCHDVAVRAARYRLAHDASMEPGERALFEELAASPERQPQEPTSGRNPTWAVYPVPSSYRVNRVTAFPQAPADLTAPPVTG